MQITHVVKVSTENIISICQLLHLWQWPEKMMREKWWMNWLANSVNRDQVSLHPCGPASWLQKNCHGKSSNSKRNCHGKFSNSKCSTPHLYKAVLQVLEIRVPLFRREDIHHGENAVCLGLNRGDIRKWDGKSSSVLEVWVSELKGKKIQKE